MTWDSGENKRQKSNTEGRRTCNFIQGDHIDKRGHWIKKGQGTYQGGLLEEPPSSSNGWRKGPKAETFTAGWLSGKAA